MFKKGNTSWPHSTKLMKVLVTNGLNRLPSLQKLSWYTKLFTVFLSDILWIYDDGSNSNFEVSYSFYLRNPQRYYHWIVRESTEKILKEFYKGSPEENFVF